MNIENITLTEEEKENSVNFLHQKFESKLIALHEEREKINQDKTKAIDEIEQKFQKLFMESMEKEQDLLQELNIKMILKQQQN